MDCRVKNINKFHQFAWHLPKKVCLFLLENSGGLTSKCVSDKVTHVDMGVAIRAQTACLHLSRLIQHPLTGSEVTWGQPWLRLECLQILVMPKNIHKNTQHFKCPLCIFSIFRNSSSRLHAALINVQCLPSCWTTNTNHVFLHFENNIRFITMRQSS